MSNEQRRKTSASTITNIISIFAVFVNIVLVIITSQQLNETIKQTTTARGAEKEANKALCHTLETGIDVVELTRLSLLNVFATPLTQSQQQEFKDKLTAQEAYFTRLQTENDCPPRIGK